MANSHRRSQLGPGASVPTQNFDALIPSHKIWKRLSQDPLKKKKQLINLQPHPQYYDFSSPKIIKKKKMLKNFDVERKSSNESRTVFKNKKYKKHV